MAGGCYNHIYSVLVENEQDTLGIIAYSLYKRQKIEFIQAFKEKNGREPRDENLAPFHDVSNSPSQIEGYRNQASQLEQYYSDKASTEIRQAKPGFWLGVTQSLVGSILFVFLLGFLVFFTWSLNQGPKQVIEQVFDVTILDSVSHGEPAGS
jgi:hypothetical protein